IRRKTVRLKMARRRATRAASEQGKEIAGIRRILNTRRTRSAKDCTSAVGKIISACLTVTGSHICKGVRPSTTPSRAWFPLCRIGGAGHSSTPQPRHSNGPVSALRKSDVDRLGFGGGGYLFVGC